jgi:hypothetical protein
VLPPPELSVQTAFVQAPPSSLYCTEATPEAPLFGSPPLPVIVYALELTQAGIAFRLTVGGVVSMFTVRLTVVVFPATSVAVST